MAPTDLDKEITNMRGQISKAQVDLLKMEGALEAFVYLKAKLEQPESKPEEAV